MFKDEGRNGVLYIKSIVYQCTGTASMSIQLGLCDIGAPKLSISHAKF